MRILISLLVMLSVCQAQTSAPVPRPPWAAGSKSSAAKEPAEASKVDDNDTNNSLINRAIKSGVEKGVFSQPKGASGPVKLAKKDAEKKVTEKPPAKAKSSEKKAATKKSPAKVSIFTTLLWNKTCFTD